ncbi:hypothetical protein PybrP1_006194 [[Pythium] brassicae (nom. inval.)]|nr:hypothetical protein PybrP1_006194 [[Pythium] brassicae (nom. inval.)]
MDPCKRKAAAQPSSVSFASHQTPRDNSALGSSSGSRRPGRHMKQKLLFQIVVAVLLALGSRPGGCNLSADAQFMTYLNELADARRVHVAAASTAPTRVDVVLKHGRGYKWVTIGDDTSVEYDGSCVDPYEFEFAGEPYRVTEQTSARSNELLRVCERDNKSETNKRFDKFLRVESQDLLVTLALESDECPCRHGGNKTCLFVHGIGVHEDVGVQDDFEDYWGKQVKSSLPCCAVVKFTRFDTVSPPWYSRTMSRELCRAAIAVSRNETYQTTNSTTDGDPRSEANDSSSNISSSSTTPPTSRRKELKDMVLIAHSTGNLHLASAFLYGDCHLDRATSRWLAIQGPMDGTNTANRVIDACQQPNTTWDDLAKEVLEGFELCPITGSTKSLALRDSKAAGSCLDSLYEKAGELFRAEVSAVMCGVSPVGIVSPSSPRFVALSKFSNHSSPLNDGAVEFGSCRGGVAASAFAPSFQSRFYKAEINHDDGRLIHGDGVWGETRKPLKWLQCQF